MKFQNTAVFNFEGAFRGLRNPLESWAKSDSFFGLIDLEYDDYRVDGVAEAWVENQLSNTELQEGKEPIEQGSEEWLNLFDGYIDWILGQGILRKVDDSVDIAAIGPKDLNLAQRMIKAGSSDRKFLRQIMVSVDITAPLYWWKEFDTYKIGTTANSTSTMHKISSTPITPTCFELDDYHNEVFNPELFINDLEMLRQKYNETKDQRYWKELIRWLPEGWLQTRTVTLNYEILKNIYTQRRHHRLVEWHNFCDWVKTLPYSYELITFNID